MVLQKVPLMALQLVQSMVQLMVQWLAHMSMVQWLVHMCHQHWLAQPSMVIQLAHRLAQLMVLQMVPLMVLQSVH